MVSPNLRSDNHNTSSTTTQSHNPQELSLTLTPSPTSTTPTPSAPSPAIMSDDTQSVASSGFGSYADFQSQAELFPQSQKVEKKKNGGDGGIDVEKGGPKKESPKEKEYSGIKRYGGMLLTVGASVCFSLVTLLVKLMGEDYKVDPYSSSFWRYLGITLPTIPMLIYFQFGPGRSTLKGSLFDPVWPIMENKNWKTWIGLFSRGVIGATSVILRYYSLQYLSIGDTSVITYSTPVLVTVMAHFFLGEKCGVVSILVAFTTLVGVFIVSKPPLLTGQDSFDSETLIGTALACGSLFFSSLIVIITRKIREVHFALMILVFGSIGVLESGILAFAHTPGYLHIPTGSFDALMTAGIAGLSFIGQMSIVLALKFEQAGPVALLRSCDIIFGFLLQYIVMGIVPDIYSSLGSTIVFASVIVIASRKWIKTLPEESGTRRWFGWVLK